jgi:protein tyrosine/serine phosphatase
MPEQLTRNIPFEAVHNARDLGGYKARGGRTVAWRRLFRSGELHNMTARDLAFLTEQIKLKSVIDLRSDYEIKRHGTGPLAGSGIKYFNISLISDGGNRQANEQRYKKFTNMGQFYVDLALKKEFGEGIAAALAIIAAPENHPLLFHCSAGKDRTGLLAALLLSVLGVTDKDIKTDYCLSAAYVETVINLIKNQPEMAAATSDLPGYFWVTAPESIALLLSTLCREYGSVEGYLKEMGMETSLPECLQRTLLV